MCSPEKLLRKNYSILSPKYFISLKIIYQRNKTFTFAHESIRSYCKSSVFLWETLCSLAKLLHSIRNFAFACETFMFAHKTIGFSCQSIVPLRNLLFTFKVLKYQKHWNKVSHLWPAGWGQEPREWSWWECQHCNIVTIWCYNIIFLIGFPRDFKSLVSEHKNFLKNTTFMEENTRAMKYIFSITEGSVVVIL